MKRFIYILLLWGTTPLALLSQTDLILKKIITCGETVCILEIYKDTHSNCYLCLFDDNITYKKNLIDISGCGNCNTNNIIIKPYIFDSKNDCIQYVIEISDLTSTYGATNLFFIWYLNQWNIIISPFQRYLIKDLDNNGIFEIVDYTASEEGIVYSFNNGDFIRF